MFRSLINGASLENTIIAILINIPIALLALSVHEAAHGYISNKLGDPTARNLGRITINPIKHLDPIGFICMVLFNIGWANPVPINTRYFKKPRRDMALSAAAGPISNLLLAVVFALLMKLFFSLPVTVLSSLGVFTEIIILFLMQAISLNVFFAVFNLIPVPPFDGSRILYVFLPPKYYFGVMKYERYICLGFMLLLFFGVLDPVLNLLSGTLENLIYKIIF